MSTFNDRVADTVLQTFDGLPRKFKPILRTNNVQEWVPLSGIVLSRGRDLPLNCASLATGSKCLPHDKLSLANGYVLHDWHAEILAIRAFNRFLIDECNDLATSGSQESDFVRRRREDEVCEENFQPFAIRDGTGIHMYCSEAPCGDASMEILMAEQADLTPWPAPATTPSADLSKMRDDGSARDEDGNQETPLLHGRGYFSELSIVRRKPSRPDARLTLSKSCSDKLSHRQATSLLSSITSLLVQPSSAYVHSLILPSSQYSAVACDRAFGPKGRMASLVQKQDSWTAGYRFAPFTVETTSREFAFSRRKLAPPRSREVFASTTDGTISSNKSTVYNPRRQELLINGILQGRKAFDPRGASALCRRSMWKIVLAVISSLGLPQFTPMGVVNASNADQELRKSQERLTYKDLKKHLPMLAARRRVTKDVRNEALKGWIPNEGDGHFVLETAKADEL